MSDATELEPWQWPEETWRAHVERVRAGRALVPKNWPGGAQVAVGLSFDSDHETIPLRDGETRPGKLAAGEYGARVAVPKILRMLGEFEIPVSFYIPAVSALLHPDEVTAYVAGGHEVAVHGWIHERNMLLERDAEFDLLGRCIEVLERLSGTRPVGMRTPSWDFSDNTLDALLEFGFRYDSSLMADDEPYEILADNEPTGVVEIPVEWIRDDAPYFMFDRYASLRPHMPPRSALQIWKDEFDAAYAEGGLFQLTMHPHIIGHRSRLVVLRELIQYINGHPGVWYATHADIAEQCAAQLGQSSTDQGESS
ncbi:polysaccharide deacetylase [Propionibacteriaceae bacterium ES.041]|uniref:Polysaccharide deacetylase n=1 Tax=Enemella evansiae TaxID=2016499 RepID=A0A255GKM5_9ACTN|nr:polysaccharide deacetylase [Enemella evansiae]OYO02923.1 polysaccharide deacetylase [Enemella evansiae]OYO12218.1 polysaccharide deacetylase [Enemella evansiae]OYO16377.1 polysaccharide deacetylase [Enemella evansiae]PFG69335.1 polysaccharide deacetylase [Propionibacteriaceae bacterium ES.041]